MSKSTSFERARRLIPLVLIVLPWAASAQPRGGSAIEAAPPGRSYDYVVHVRNTYDYGYNPEVREDRVSLARSVVRPYCSRNRIVAEDSFNPEIFGITTSKPQYVVYVKCLR